MKNKIDWLNHGLEFFVVIIGILIAFQLNTCSTEKEQDELVDTHLTQIIKETEFNRLNFTKAIEHCQSNLSKLDTIFQLMATNNNRKKINRLAIELLNLGGVYIRKNAYSNLTQSADIRFMKDFEQKSKIINLYEYYIWVEAFDEISMNLYNSDFYPYLKENFDLVASSIQSDDVYNSKLFKNILVAYYRTSQQRLKKYKDCLLQIDKYLEN